MSLVRTIFSFFQDLGAVLGEILAGPAAVARGAWDRYWALLKRATVYFGAGTVICLIAILIGVVFHQQWLISIPGILLFALFGLWAVLGAPLGVPGLTVAEIGRVKAYFRMVAALLLGGLLFVLYLSVVPVSNNPRAIFLILVVAMILGLLWAAYGIGPDLQRIRASVVTAGIVTTIAFFMPKTFTAAGDLRGRLDERLAKCLEDLPACFRSNKPKAEVAVSPPEPTPPIVRQPTAARPAQQQPGAAPGVSPAAGVPERAAVLEVTSEPPSADVYLDWTYKGQTPLQIEGPSLAGLLVVGTAGLGVESRRIDFRTSTRLHFRLSPPPSRVPSIFVLVEGDEARSLQAILRDSLASRDMVLVAQSAISEFEAQRSRGGQLSQPIFRAWMRSMLGADVIVLVHASSSIRPVTDVGYRQVEQAARGLARADVTLDAEVVNLRGPGEGIRATASGSKVATEGTAAHAAAAAACGELAVRIAGLIAKPM